MKSNGHPVVPATASGVISRTPFWSQSDNTTMNTADASNRPYKDPPHIVLNNLENPAIVNTRQILC